MKPSAPQIARLLLPDGSTVLLQKTCSIGRSLGNDIVINHEKVSRRHALVHSQENGRFCFVDLGSSNGSYVNGRRVVQPVILKNGDLVDVGTTRIQFCDPQENDLRSQQDDQHTLHEIRTAELWLMVADIQDSTRLASQVGEHEIPRVTGRWLAECKTRLEGFGGAINKFLGDGFFAYWPGETNPALIADALSVLREMQKLNTPGFRVVLHRGKAFLGGKGSMGEENLTGRDVNFVFRMEKLAGSLKLPLMVSAEARLALGDEFDWIDSGLHSMTGFDGTFSFHSIGAEEN